MSICHSPVVAFSNIDHTFYTVTYHTFTKRRKGFLVFSVRRNGFTLVLLHILFLTSGSFTEYAQTWCLAVCLLAN